MLRVFTELNCVVVPELLSSQVSFDLYYKVWNVV